MASIFASATANKKSSFATSTTGGGSSFGSIKQDIKTSEGLRQRADQLGYGKEADEILARQGEDPGKIYSGGFISDTFDTLNALQYGVVGMVKGKTFMEGVKTRQSFSDQDALGKFGWKGAIAGIAADIALDPLTYVAPWTIAKKIPGAAKAGKAVKTALFGEMAEKTISGGRKVQTLEGGSTAGKYLARKFKWAFGQDPIYREIGDRSTRNILVGNQNLRSMVEKGVINLPQKKAAQLFTKDKTGRFIRKGLDELIDFTPEEIKNVQKVYKSLDDLGDEAVDLGILTRETFEKNKGVYIKSLFETHELPVEKGKFDFLGTKLKGVKARKKLSPEKLKELGQIENPAYILFKSVADLSKEVENTKLFNKVAANFGSDEALDGFQKIVGKGFGALDNKYVPQSIFDDLTELTRTKSVTEKNLGKVVAGFKFNKVIMNPATHARNIMSNQVLNWWKLGMNPLDPRTISAQAEAMGQIVKKSGKWIDEAKTVGYNLDTYAAAEIKDLLLSPDSAKALTKMNKGWRKIVAKLGDVYQGEENFAKLTAFIYKRKAGMGIEDAWKAAESATFNYAQVTPFVRRVRESIFGMPFITFSIKATPLAAETALKAPHRISAFGKVKKAIENQADQDELFSERANEPSWIKDGFYIKLPMKDKNGNSAYFDLTYIVPFGDLMSGQFFTRGTDRETGQPESIISSATEKTPFFNLLKELNKNQDFYGDKIWRDSDSPEKQSADLMRHLTKTYLPPLVADQIPGGYMPSGEKRIKGIRGVLDKDSASAQQRTLMQEMMRNVGLKVQPINTDMQETYSEWNKKKALETLLLERGGLKEFSRTYIPK